MLERPNQQIKRRTRVAALLPNEASLLRPVGAILSETSDDSQTGRISLRTCLEIQLQHAKERILIAIAWPKRAVQHSKAGHFEFQNTF